MPLTILHPLPRAVQTPDPRPAARAQAPPRRAGCSLRRPHGGRFLLARPPAPLPQSLPPLAQPLAAGPGPGAGSTAGEGGGEGRGRRGGSCAQPASGAGKEGTSPRQPAGGGTGLERRGGQPQGAGGTLAGSRSASRASNGLRDAGQRSPGPPRCAGFVLHGPQCGAGAGGGAGARLVPLPPLPGTRQPLEQPHHLYWGTRTPRARAPGTHEPPLPALGTPRSLSTCQTATSPGMARSPGWPWAALADSPCHRQGGGGSLGCAAGEPGQEQGRAQQDEAEGQTSPSHRAGSLGPAGLQ